ncbi:hypothetical protein ScPMuIL_010544 [Solemya velum]
MSMPIARVNELDCEEFVQIFGNAVEHCSICAAAVWRHSPFNDVYQIYNKTAEFLDQLPISGKEAVLRLHPDLAGKLAISGRLTNESSREQTLSGMLALSETEKEMLERLNTSYKSKFKFPFVICVRENKKKAIFDGIRARLANTPEEETLVGLEEVKKICRLRLLDIVDPGCPKL